MAKTTKRASRAKPKKRFSFTITVTTEAPVGSNKVASVLRAALPGTRICTSDSYIPFTEITGVKVSPVGEA